MYNTQYADALFFVHRIKHGIITVSKSSHAAARTEDFPISECEVRFLELNGSAKAFIRAPRHLMEAKKFAPPTQQEIDRAERLKQEAMKATDAVYVDESGAASPMSFNSPRGHYMEPVETEALRQATARIKGSELIANSKSMSEVEQIKLSLHELSEFETANDPWGIPEDK